MFCSNLKNFVIHSLNAILQKKSRNFKFAWDLWILTLQFLVCTGYCKYLFDLQALTDFQAELRDDPIITTHLAKLYDNLLEQNLIRVIEPFSRVQVEVQEVWMKYRFHSIVCISGLESLLKSILISFWGTAILTRQYCTSWYLWFILQWTDIENLKI